MTHDDALPAMPLNAMVSVDDEPLYTADQMRAYARAAQLKAERDTLAALLQDARDILGDMNEPFPGLLASIDDALDKAKR